MNPPAVVSAVAAVLSFLWGVWAWWSANKSKAARVSAVAAQEAAEAARDTAEAQVMRLSRMAEALEAANAARAPWDVQPMSRSEFRLANRSGVDAAAVSVDTKSPIGVVEMGDVPASSERVFHVVRHGGFEGEIAVTWTTPGNDEPRTVTLALPHGG